MPDELIGLIPAAGKGLRLGLPYPKELYPIIRDNRYKPVSQYVLENLTAAGVEHVVFVINETKHQLLGYFGDGRRFGCRISYVVQEQRDENGRSTSPGLAHALHSAYHLVRDKTVCFGMPDTIMSPLDVFGQLLEGQRVDDEVALGLFPMMRPEKVGMVKSDNENRVISIVDKPQRTSLTHGWGCIVWRPQFTEHLRTCIEQWGIMDFAAVMNLAIEQGMSFRGVPIAGGSYVDLGTYEDIMELERQYRAP